MRIFFSVGEPSGDLHGSNLIRALKARQPDSQFFGFGGPKMAAAGCVLERDMSDLAIMGIARVVPHLKTFWNLLQQADRFFEQQRPDAVVLIDYPGFNWWVARKAKQRGIPVFYYGTPQIWAWATYRVRKLRRLVDHSLCKLPFEPDWYRQHDCQATYVGHPYFDDFVDQSLDQEFLRTFDGQQLVTVLPGSRRSEVTNNLPAFLRTIDHVHAAQPNTKFAIASYNEQQAAMARQIVMQHNGTALPVIHVNRTRELIRSATVCLACSGSVSLELLHELKPTVIHYKIDRFVNFLQKRMRRIKFFTLVNLLNSENRFEYRQEYDPNDVEALAEAPFPEYLAVEDRSDEMAQHLLRWLTSETSRREAIDLLEPLRQSFAKPGASKSAATYITNQLAAEPTLPGSFSVKKVA